MTTSQNSYYSDPQLAGWRGNLARAHRAHQAAVARDKRNQARLRRDFNNRMKEVGK